MGKRRKVKESKGRNGIASTFRRFCVSTFLRFDVSTFLSLFAGMVFASLAATLPGCAVGAASAGGQQSDPPEALPQRVDLARARVPLDRIEPSVQRPVRSDPVKPLSQRGAGRMAQARALIAEQRYTEAAFELEDALRYDPNHPDILRELAQLHWQAGNGARAKLHASRAIKVNSNDAVVHYVLGRCHASSGENSSAIAQYRTALVCSDFGRDREAAALCQYYLAEILAVEGYLEASLARYEAFEDLAGSISPQTNDTELMRLLRAGKGVAGEQKSAVLAKLGRFKEAADALAPQVAAAGDDFSLGMRYARLLLRGGRFEEARAAARAVPSGSGEILELLLDISRRAGHPDGAVEDLRTRLASGHDDPQRVLDLAEGLRRLEQPAEAARELQSFLGRRPEAEAVRARLVDVLLDASKWIEALEVCAAGVARQPDRAAVFEGKIAALASNTEAKARILGDRGAQENPFSAYLRGLLAVEAGELEQAETLLRTSYSADSTFTPARVALARLHLRTNRYAEALRIAARADEGVAEGAGLETVLGEVYERLDDLAQAELHFKAALQLNRADPDTMFALAEVHRRSGDRLKARRQLRVLLTENPVHEPARETLIRLYLDDGEVDAAREQFDEIKRHGATATTRARCGALLDFIRDRDRKAYRAALIQAAEHGNVDATTWTAIAESYPEEELDRAKEAYLNALALDPNQEKALLGVIYADRRLLNFELAVEGLESLLPRRPNRHSWRFELMELYRAIQNDDAALSLARAQEAREDIDDEARTGYRLELLQTLELVGRRGDVFRLVKDWAEEDPDNRGWRLRLAALHLLDDQPSQAVGVYQELYRLDPDDDATLVDLINALAAAGRHDRACQYTLDLLNEDPDNDKWMSLLLWILGDAERSDEALELVRNKLLQTQAREGFQDSMINRLNRAGRHEECVEWIEGLMDQVMATVRRRSAPPGHEPPGEVFPEQIMQRPNEPSSLESLNGRRVELRAALARTLILGEKNREAEKRLTGWLDATRNPGTRFEYLFLLRACLGEQGKTSEAEETLQQALALRPNSIVLNNDVAYGWIDRGVRLDEAEVMIRYALSRSPRQPAYLDTYGWLLYKRGEFVSAKKWLLRAVRARDGEDPVILDHLGDACWRAGLAGEALTHWEGAAGVIKEMPEDELDTEDERRVRDAIAKKIEQARSGGVPNVAPTAKE